MNISTLSLINKILHTNFEYAYQVYNGDANEFWVGSYREIRRNAESGCIESDFTVEGVTFGDWLTLEKGKEKLVELFTDYTTTNDGVGVYINFEDVQTLTFDDRDIKRIQVTLLVKEWKGK